MLVSLLPILLITLLLVGGYLLSQLLSPALRQGLTRQITPLVMVLLMVMGVEFGAILMTPGMGLRIVGQAFLFASLISLITFLLLMRKSTLQSSTTRAGGVAGLLRSIMGCVKAIGCLLIGILWYQMTGIDLQHYAISSSYVLYLLIFLVGIDLAHLPLRRDWISNLRLPCLAILAGLLSAALFSIVSDYSLLESLAVSSGYGWFSLSGPMLGKLLGQEMGTMALMTDLFRECWSIVLLYLFGQRYPASAIGVSGAAALDSALPFVKENCRESEIQNAIVSGFLLTLLVPFLLYFFAALV